MSKITGLRQKWTALDIQIPIDIRIKASKLQLIQGLHFIGQEFVKNARDGGSYSDHTGNLRSSIGYTIFDDNRVVDEFYEESSAGDQNGEGVATGKELAEMAISESPMKGLILVVTAGMEYALAVESKGYNVLTAFAPTESEVKNDLEKLLKYVE